jgi:hypothetical protein
VAPGAGLIAAAVASRAINGSYLNQHTGFARLERRGVVPRDALAILVRGRAGAIGGLR